MKRETAAKFVATNILGSQEVQDILKINRSRLGAMVESGKIKPIKELKREKLFWLPDVLALRSELILDTRSNLFKQDGQKETKTEEDENLGEA